MNNLFSWSDGTWRLLDQAGILVADVMMAATVIGGIAGFINRERLLRWLSGNRFPSVGGDIEGRRWQGIVFTISKKEVPQWVIERLKPRCIGLIATRQSMSAADELARIARGNGIEALPPRRLENADNPSESLDKTRELLIDLRARGCEDCAVDVTGGKTPMSLGAFMAAEEMRADTLYVTGRYDAELRNVDLGSAQIQRISTPN